MSSLYFLRCDVTADSFDMSDFDVVFVAKIITVATTANFVSIPRAFLHLIVLEANSIAAPFNFVRSHAIANEAASWQLVRMDLAGPIQHGPIAGLSFLATLES